MSSPTRTYPLRKPKHARPPIPKWHLQLSSDASYVYTAYIGMQKHPGHESTLQAVQFAGEVQTWIESKDGPAATESFDMISGGEREDSSVWVCYWLDVGKFHRALQDLSLSSIYTRLPEAEHDSIGIWVESFSTAVSRLETTYSGSDYLPGLGRLPGTCAVEHSFSGYWGAARDRIPGSSHDLFATTEAASQTTTSPTGLYQHLVGTNANNLVHIRSGQSWEGCSQEEADAYEQSLEPLLSRGIQDLWENGQASGAIGVRYLRNQDLAASPVKPRRKETCAAGFFTSLEHLEKWAKSHPLHQKIYLGALKHYKVFDEGRKLRTWHEVSVIREGDARFEYINCVASTGVIQSIPLEAGGISVDGN